MPNPSSQPTITVKTADGKTVKMTLAEFRARQAVQSKPAAHAKQADHAEQATLAEQAPQADKQIMQSKATSQKSITYHVSPITPPPITHDAKKLYPTPSTLHPTKETWEDDDHLSLLDIPFESDSSARLAPVQETDDTKISSLAGRFATQWALSLSLENRLRSLVQSRMKDIRTDLQMREYAKRDLAHGGLGLTEEQAETLAREVQNAMGISRKQPPMPRTQKTPLPKAASAPVAFPVSVSAPKRQDMPPMQKQILHDIAPAPPAAAGQHKESVGPVEEMRAIALADFRRLGRTPRDAADVLARKFAMAKDESFLLFLDAKDAWRESPLSREYFSLMTRSLSGEGTIAAIAGKVRGGGQMTSEEFMAVAGLNKTLQ